MRERQVIRESYMTGRQKVLGGLVTAFYLLVFPFSALWLQLRIPFWQALPPAETMVLRYCALALLLLVLFWSFFRRDLRTLLARLPDTLVHILTGAALWAVLDLLVRCIPLPVSDPNEETYLAEYLFAPGATLLILLLLMPLVEELVFRGFLFGTLREKSRPLAYLVTASGYALYCVWQFAFAYGAVDLRYLSLALRYLPAGLLLGWCYEKSGSVWAALLLHTAINGLTLLRILS